MPPVKSVSPHSNPRVSRTSSGIRVPWFLLPTKTADKGEYKDNGHAGRGMKGTLERMNTSVLTMSFRQLLGTRYLHHDRNILIDCGKSYYESARQWFPVHNIDHIDALVRDSDNDSPRPSPLFAPMYCDDITIRLNLLSMCSRCSHMDMRTHSSDWMIFDLGA